MSTYCAGYWPTYSYDNILNCIEKLIKPACVEYKSSNNQECDLQDGGVMTGLIINNYL